MQVSHVQDHVTHAVIGGDATIDFGISDSAEFFNILSSTLYKNQKLAVVRETLCNAWDAHIEAGKKDTPIDLVLTGELFSIRDYGLGIAKDKIGPIYGVYGGSTKKNDGKQTGGFGLGCKAPFAYTDHFEVQSNHGGVRTIYNMSKSSAQVMGKPGIIPIASFPTTETGLLVTIHLKASHDRSDFETLIRQIVRNGEMNATLNGKPLEVTPFSAAKHDFLISEEGFEETNSIIMVRYGNVIYPVSDHAEYHTAWERIIKLMNKLHSGYSGSMHITFMAPPHSISVQPSREGLSMQDHTVGTLKKILNAFTARLDTEFTAERESVLTNAINASVLTNNVGELLHHNNKIPGLSQMALGNRQYITEVATMARYYATRHYPSDLTFHKKDVLQRLSKLFAVGYNRGLVGSFAGVLKATTVVKSNWGSSDSFENDHTFKWFHRHVVYPITRGMEAAGLKADRLVTIGHGFRSRSTMTHAKAVRRLSEMNSDDTSAFAYLPYLRNIMVISYTRNDVQSRMENREEIKNTLGNLGGYFAYIVPRRADRVAEALAYFEAKGMVVFDLTKAGKGERIDIAEPAEKIASSKKKTQPGLPVLGHALKLPNKNSVALTLCRGEDAPRILEPEFYFRINPKGNEEGGDYAQQTRIGLYGEEATLAIVKLFGDKGGMTLNEKQEAKLKAQGVKPLDDYLCEKVIAHVTSNQRVLDYLTGYSERMLKGMGQWERDRDHGLTVQTIFNDRKLCKELGIPHDITVEDQLYLAIWEQIKVNFGQYRSSPHQDVLLAQKKIDDLPTNSTAQDVFEMIKGNQVLDLIDMTKAGMYLRASKTKVEQERSKQVRDVILLALMG